MCWPPRARGSRPSGSSARSSSRARCRSISTGCASGSKGSRDREGMSGPPHDLAHIGHADLLTPLPEDSLRFFVDLFGMEIEHRDSGSVYLRGWGDYQRYSLKLTESELPGLGQIGIRAWGRPGLERRVAAIE